MLFSVHLKDQQFQHILGFQIIGSRDDQNRH